MALQRPDDIISFSTDSVICREKLNTPLNPDLGDFALDMEGQGVFVMSDFYNIWNDKKIKNKMRGFSVVSTKDIDEKTIYLKDILANMEGSTYTYYTKRPAHLGECIAHVKTKTIAKNLNVFMQSEREVNINSDEKRVWNKNFRNGKACLKESHNSNPVMVGV